jgi:hypothetical protein
MTTGSELEHLNHNAFTHIVDYLPLKTIGRLSLSSKSLLQMVQGLHYKCRGCNEPHIFRIRGRPLYCDRCEELTCNKCTRKCFECSHISKYCVNCVTPVINCLRCEGFICKTCGPQLNKCPTCPRHCAKCVYKCVACDLMSCEPCDRGTRENTFVICKECRKFVCQDCFRLCRHCGSHFCPCCYTDSVQRTCTLGCYQTYCKFCFPHESSCQKCQGTCCKECDLIFKCSGRCRQTLCKNCSPGEYHCQWCDKSICRDCAPLTGRMEKCMRLGCFNQVCPQCREKHQCAACGASGICKDCMILVENRHYCSYECAPDQAGDVSLGILSAL